MSSLSVILPAAGLSTRFGRNKLLAMLEGETVVARSVAAFAVRDDVDVIVLVTSDLAIAHGALGDLTHDPRIKIVLGGLNRAESVRAGLAACGLAPDVDTLVAIHDAARPLVSQALIDRTFAAARAHGAAVPALPVHLTIKQAAGPLPAPVVRTLPRAELWTMQTPQIIRPADLLAAYDRCPVPLDQVTDDAQLLELAGFPVMLVEGEEQNLKVTTPADLVMAQWWLGKF